MQAKLVVAGDHCTANKNNCIFNSPRRVAACQLAPPTCWSILSELDWNYLHLLLVRGSAVHCLLVETLLSGARQARPATNGIDLTGQPMGGVGVQVCRTGRHEASQPASQSELMVPPQ